VSAAKPPDRRQRRGSPALTIVTYEDREAIPDIPAPPEDLSADNLAAWNTYWASALAQAVTLPTDLPALRRLFRMYDDLEQSWTKYMRDPEVDGSMGQRRISHFAKHIAELEPMIRALEDRFGLSPKARLELGVTLGDAARSLQDLYPSPGEGDIPADLFVPTTAVRVAARP